MTTTTTTAKVDIFDRIEKEIQKNPALKDKSPVLKEFIPPKVERIELSKQIVDLIRIEIYRSFLKQRPEKVVEYKGPDEKQIGDLINKSVSEVMSQVREIQRKSKEDLSELIKLREENQKLKEDVKKLQEEPEFRVIHQPYPNQENKRGQFLTTDGREPKWGPEYENGTDPYIPIGDQSKDGSWRIILTSGSISVQKRESGAWGERGGFV